MPLYTCVCELVVFEMTLECAYHEPTHGGVLRITLWGWVRLVVYGIRDPQRLTEGECSNSLLFRR